ncbi:MAG: hypothetical protein K8J31_17610 [Anaerolineae bacterium]|nr:hypothetical protein [Anaerolineae bacterium]
MNQPEALYRLQEVDLDLLRSQKRVKEIALVLANDEVLQAAQSDVKAAQNELSPLRNHLRQLEDEIEVNEDKTRTTDQQLYSGNVKNPKELQDMQQEIESLKRWHDELETNLLETMLSVEEAESRLNQAEGRLRAVADSRGEEHRQLLEEQTALQAHIEQAKQRRQHVLKEVAPENLKIYSTMRVRKQNQPVAVMSGNTCSICGVAQTFAIEREVRQGVKLVSCSNCERILVSL